MIVSSSSWRVEKEDVLASQPREKASATHHIGRRKIILAAGCGARFAARAVENIFDSRAKAEPHQ